MRPVDRAARPGLEPVWVELARRLGASDRPVASITVRELTDESRTVLADLLGLDRMPGASARVGVAHLMKAVGVDDFDSLRSIVEELAGPVGNRWAERARRQAERETLWAWVADESARLELGSWSSWLRGLGVPRGDVAGHRLRIDAALRVLDRIARGDTGLVLAHLANDVLGDPHGLDPGQPVAGLVVEALARRAGGAGERRAEVVRALWSSAGVATDTLSPTVLVLGLRSAESDPVAAMLGRMADDGEPAVLTARQLQRWPVQLVGGGDVVVVENPSIVAHFADSDSSSLATPAPVVCTGGWPNVAVLTLLRQLVASGCRLLGHADFDPAGVLILRFLIEQVTAEPWEMTADRYEASLDRSTVGFDGPVADTPWDTRLAEAMRAHRRAVFEENVRHELGSQVPSS